MYRGILGVNAGKTAVHSSSRGNSGTARCVGVSGQGGWRALTPRRVLLLVGYGSSGCTPCHGTRRLPIWPGPDLVSQAQEGGTLTHCTQEEMYNGNMFWLLTLQVSIPMLSDACSGLPNLDKDDHITHSLLDDVESINRQRKHLKVSFDKFSNFGQF